MRDFRKQRNRSHDVFNFLVRCAGVVAVLAFATLSAHAAWDMYQKFAIASQADDAAKSDLSDLEGQYARVSAAVADLSTARGEEGEIRERFGVAKPGEGAIEIIRTATTTDGAQNQLPQDLWSRILRAFVVW
ncbi:MAG TPA: hypothetical protein VN701_00355 [Candidatus Paceibacterota bacterium]|nr:hypothetical protein [Candidatus Paceibacterota bacterium]